MGLGCKIFGHKWNGCKCAKCGETRDEGHDWDFICEGQCKRCGKKSAVSHDWDLCKGKCKRCGKMQVAQHEWIDYQCSRCGKVEIETPVNQDTLAAIAKSDMHIDVRKAAVKRLTDQRVLADIAKDSTSYVRIAAIRKLTDQGVLADIAKSDNRQDPHYCHVRVAAVKRLTNQEILIDFAKNDYQPLVRSEAVKRIADQEVLSKIANNSKEGLYVRLEAAKKLGDKALEQNISSAISYENFCLSDGI